MSQALSAYAQDGIRGRVLDEQGKGLDAAVVMGHGESRKILLRLTYGFGKQKFEKIDRDLEELNR